MKRELLGGTLAARQTIVQMLLYLHGYYLTEEDFLLEIREIILKYSHELCHFYTSDQKYILCSFLLKGAWHVRNVACKCICVLYRAPSNQMYFVENGAIEAIADVMSSKSQGLSSKNVCQKELS